MKLSTGLAVSAALALAAPAANAQAPSAGRPHYQAASDVDGPYVGGPPPARGYYAPPPGYGPPPVAYRASPPYGPPLLPPQEVYAVLRDNGFSPLGIPHQRGLVYVIAVLDRGGEDGRLVIDARDGRIIRFTPAFRWGGGPYEDRYAPPPPPGGLAPTSGDARPQISVPHMASRNVPLPAPKPSAAKLGEAPPQKSAAVEVKPAALPPVAKPVAPPANVQAAAPAMPSTTANEVKPAPSIAPTQPMPKVQGLE